MNESECKFIWVCFIRIRYHFTPRQHWHLLHFNTTPYRFPRCVVDLFSPSSVLLSTYIFYNVFFFFCPDTNGIGLCLPIVTKRNKTEGIAIKAPFQSLRKKKSTKKFYICLFYFYKGGFLCILNHIYMCNYSVAKVLINTLLLPKKNFIKQRILLFFLYNLKFYSLTALYLMHYSTL